MKRVPIIVEIVRYGTVRVITEDSRAEFSLQKTSFEVIDLQTLNRYAWYTEEGCGPLFLWHKFVPPSVTGEHSEYTATVYNLQELRWPLYELDLRDRRLNTVLFLDEGIINENPSSISGVNR